MRFHTLAEEFCSVALTQGSPKPMLLSGKFLAQDAAT